MSRCVRWALGLGGALLALQAAGQQPAPQRAVAQLKQLNGNVLVSRDTGMTAGAELLKVTNGTRIITTANSEVVVVFDNGCEVRMKENQRLDVDSDKPCAGLVPANLAVAAPAAGPGFVGLLVPGLLGAGGAAAGVGGGVVVGTQSVSPN
ncbi:MAG TPA: hypothetical protein VFZ61_31515 [Polyangiales bacterium]